MNDANPQTGPDRPEASACFLFDADQRVARTLACCHCERDLRGVERLGQCPHCFTGVGASVENALQLAGLDPEGRVRVGRTCANCGYDIRSLHFDAGCPECGHAIRATVMAAPAGAGDLEWLQRVADGSSGFIVAIGALFVGCVGLPLAIVAGVESARCSVVLIAMGLLASLISVWLLAATRRHENAGERRLRKSLRIVWLAALASLCLAALPEYRSIDRGMSLAALTLCSVSILLLLYRLQAIEFHGRIRTHDAALSSHGATMMNWWFCTIALLVAGAFTYLFQDTEFPWAPLCTALPMVSISALWLVGATLIRMQRIVAGAQRRIQRCHANYQEMIGAAPAVNR